MKPLLAAALASLLASFAAAQDSRPESRPDHGRTRNVGVLVWDGVELLDFTGPIEAFTSAGGWDPPFRVFTVTAGPEAEVRSRAGTRIVADHLVASCPPTDVLVIPGGETRALGAQYPLGKFILERERSTEVVMSVCNGVFCLADAGLLDGLEATTHLMMVGFLRQAAPKTVVHADRRWVDNGHIVTTGGVSAGIDGSLHLIGRFLGADAAAQAARRMQFEWKDEAPAAEPREAYERARRLWYAGRWADVAKEYAPIAAARPDDAVAQERLGTALVFTKRPAEGIGPLEAAVKLGRRNPRIFQALAFGHRQQGRKAASLEALRQAYAADPASFEVMRELGQALYEAGELAAALPLLERSWQHGLGDDDTLDRITKAREGAASAPGAAASRKW